MKIRISLALLFISSIITSLILPVSTSNLSLITYAYAQTYAQALATSSGNNNTITNEGIFMKRVNYFDGASGYLAYPSNAVGTNSSSKKLPAIIMIHEWWGINDNIKSMANTLAKQTGFIVLAADLFKGESTKDPNRAMQLVKSVGNNPGEALSNMQEAVKYARSLPFVDGSKIASIGWCFGGGQSLQLALHNKEPPLAATILYYGTPLVTDRKELSNIKWPVLGILFCILVL